jgi:hypothetical protein
MSARILKFPSRGCGPVRVVHADEWLVVYDGQGWPCGTRDAAVKEANAIARDLNIDMIVEAGR